MANSVRGLICGWQIKPCDPLTRAILSTLEMSRYTNLRLYLYLYFYLYTG